MVIRAQMARDITWGQGRQRWLGKEQSDKIGTVHRNVPLEPWQCTADKGAPQLWVDGCPELFLGMPCECQPVQGKGDPAGWQWLNFRAGGVSVIQCTPPLHSILYRGEVGGWNMDHFKVAGKTEPDSQAWGLCCPL